MTSLPARVANALIALGLTADTVADSLLAGGWTGLREDGLHCPVSTYLTAVLPDVEAAAVGHDHVIVVSGSGETVEVTLPRAAAVFVVAFDGGSYDDLAAVITRVDGQVIDDLER